MTRHTCGGGSPRAQRGVALAMVVWFLAAMSLLVSGIVFQARVDTRMAQQHLARAKAVAAGDGAIQLFLADLVGQRIEVGDGAGPVTAEYTLGDRKVRVELVPISGLIDLRAASEKILVELFRQRAGVDGADAKILAVNVLKLRSEFKAIEDILQAEGVSRTILDATRDLLAVGSGTAIGVDWGAAPPAVQEVLQQADPGKASSMAAGAGKGRSGRGKKKRTLSGGSLRLDALVEHDGRLMLRRRWVTTGKGGSGSLPWKFNRTEPVRVVEAG